MSSQILKCPACGRYTLFSTCPRCGTPTKSPVPMRFSLQKELKYVKYRCEVKYKKYLSS